MALRLRGSILLMLALGFTLGAIKPVNEALARPAPPPLKRTSTAQALGGTDTPLIRPAGDFDGDGSVDIAVWRPTTGVWYLKDVTRVRWGQPGDVPVPADYDGDGRTDLAVWRPGTGDWWIRRWNGVKSRLAWGRPGDVPYPGVFRPATSHVTPAVPAVWRPSNGRWYIRDAQPYTVRLGQAGDVPVLIPHNGNVGDPEMMIPGALLTVWRPSTGYWYVRNDNGTRSRLQLGSPGDIPLPGDREFGVTYFIVWRPTTGTLYLQEEGVRYEVQRGRYGDIPVVRKGVRAFWRPFTGEWLFSQGDLVSWGQLGDIPV